MPLAELPITWRFKRTWRESGWTGFCPGFACHARLAEWSGVQDATVEQEPPLLEWDFVECEGVYPLSARHRDHSRGLAQPSRGFVHGERTGAVGARDAEPFYHGARANLEPGDLLEPGYGSNYGVQGKANYVYLTATLDAATRGAELAVGDGPGRIYRVEPTGPFEDDPNLTDRRFPGNPTRSILNRRL